ncbi:signal peptidase I [Candidatus Falkowbacteria bacterium CG10_big_fil_rev_8_21_14_0_10_39_9]|uniref:Signal peptidase I n=1 Tax=Candidatus Falkowbacteria bacterium CG10_big_fil_rev_8_21_14_0_10_39_9 TaxID=1974566 RepID=A0A2M6WPH4_9BACT|nr:MAG: signal peptidase I [Candidatus Falkowbacteria bacterium CG10_big_fil_rev_8_21_14_0_10_39_9]
MLRKIFEFLKIVVISLVIILPIRYFIIQPFYVKGASMEPTFHDHQYLIIDEIGYRFNAPKRGDIVVFRYPQNPQEYFIKRVISLPGERVEIRDGNIYLYNDQYPEGFVLDESAYLADNIKTYDLSEEIVTLRAGEYFVLGDNRNASKDSRSFGAVNESFLTGRVMFRGWPFNQITVFHTPEYKY